MIPIHVHKKTLSWAWSLLLLCGWLLTAAPAQALTRRADKECLLCHVSWFDAVQTHQATLVPETASPIVVAGSTGLVSTESMCITCHDGYVVDSRLTVEADNPHHLLKKVPENLKLPDILRLDSDNEIYCGTCHTLHDFKDSAQVGSTAFMRMDNDKSQLCVACHGNRTGRKEGASHPVLRVVKAQSRIKAAELGAKFSPAGEMICQSCHQAHGKRALTASTAKSALCLTCHQEQAGLLNSRHDMRAQFPNLKNIRHQTPVKSGPCGVCHVPHHAAGNKIWARPLTGDPPAKQMCLTCHGENGELQAKRLGQYNHPVNVRPKDRYAGGVHLPLFSANGVKTPTGSVQCFSCHNVHRWDPNATANGGDVKVDGDAGNSFLRIANDGTSALCVTCHSDKRPLLTSDHNLGITAPLEKNALSMTPENAGPCSTCHVPHHAAQRRLWARPLTADEDWASQVCTSCHNARGSAKNKLVGGNDHPIHVSLAALRPGGGDIAPTLPRYDDKGNRNPDRNMVCLTCHEPHIWSRRSSPDADSYSANVEGTAADSFLRIANAPEPDLCKSCHMAQANMAGSSHDLRNTAPEATNLAGQTVQSSGLCGACHLPHNSPNSMRLWAREYGPLSENVNPIGGLCTSCHARGKPAEKRIPAIASHPAGKLVAGHADPTRGREKSTPVFDDLGHRTRVGDIGCPTCHNGHLPAAAPHPADPYPVQVRFRFLRNSSSEILCMDCHGIDSLFRYLYFHDTEKRELWRRPGPPGQHKVN